MFPGWWRNSIQFTENPWGRTVCSLLIRKQQSQVHDWCSSQGFIDGRNHFTGRTFWDSDGMFPRTQQSGCDLKEIPSTDASGSQESWMDILRRQDLSSSVALLKRGRDAEYTSCIRMTMLLDQEGNRHKTSKNFCSPFVCGSRLFVSSRRWWSLSSIVLLLIMRVLGKTFPWRNNAILRQTGVTDKVRLCRLHV